MPHLESRPGQWLVAGLLAAVLVGCDGKPGDVSGTEPSPDYWQRLEAAIEGVRTSPDHLPAERARIVAAGDVEAAVGFVRDAFRVMPDSPDGYRYPTTAGRWGAAGALRAGMGTPRDLADLLAGMLQDMGHEATVVAHRYDTTRDFHAQTPPLFAPDLDPRSLGPALAPRPPDPVPIRSQDVQAVAGKVLDAFPENQIAARLVFGAPRVLPVVQIASEDRWALADLWGPTNQLEFIDAPLRPEPASPLPTVTVRLKTLSLGEATPVTVAELTAGLDQLLGEQIHARFAPAVDSPLELLDLRPADTQVFLPTLFVPGDEKLVATGDPIDLSGARYSVTDTGLSDGHFEVTADSPGVAVGAVDILRIDASRFPSVEVAARVTDPDRQPLAGIPATLMGLTEQGEGRRARLVANRLAAPKVLFLVDGSSSLPEAYRGRGAGAVVRGVAAGIAERVPGTRFRVALERTGEAAPATDWTTDPAELEQPATASSQTSRLWEAYADANERYAPDIIVMTTDGVSAGLDGTPEPEAGADIAARIRAAAPAVMLGGGDLGAAFEGIAALTGGVALQMEDQAAGIEAATQAILRATAEASYRISFEASLTGTDQREVVLRVGDQQAAATYSVPQQPEPMLSRRLAGLYLEVEYPTGSRPVLRTLAGLDPRQSSRSSANELSRVVAEDVQVALFGQWALSIDGGAPSPSQQLERIFRHHLSLRELFEAQSEEALVAGIEAVVPLSEHAHLFSSALAGDQAGRVYEQGARFWLETHRRQVTPEGEFHREAVDLLPFTRFDAVIENPGEAFAATAAASATLALIEAQAFDDSAHSRLAGAELGFENLQDAASRQRLREAFPGYRFMASNNPPQDAAWAIDRSSGSLIPVLDDRTGGGVTVAQVESTWRTIDKGLELAGIVDGVPTSITLWAQLERAKIAKLANSTIAVLTMGTDDFSPPEPPPSFEDVKCEVMESAAGGAVGAVTGGTAVGTVLTVIGKLNDWGEFTGFGGTGIPTSLPVCP